MQRIQHGKHGQDAPGSMDSFVSWNSVLKHGQEGMLISGDSRTESGREERADGLQ